ncbi:MAG: Sporulation initiation inhibitor protein Soj [Microgenomates group bacterium GW2011_GWA2_46_16]|uniref:Chromosome partitioning protein ParA n=1 Tax=Candidatus Magasanikbacteria bacterium RIFOXYA2_FULL_44_8 TaxID=1798696 RepID=A0A1F6NL72_9BACT|nr:MAG: Sporulation initiation inhibitor protein Soj [Microgenomates group bacterium GW2011_GWA2_46_16]OGH84598.1 MAG: chromosome partitioning protein ParA [Candidatus Magasanikbacteria bacterium RIFOXYA2_FULL_44_8]
MPMVISVVNQKGGVGKTTTAVNLAAGLSEAGKFVLLVDLDPQGNATSGLGVKHLELDKGLYHALIGSHRLHDVVNNTAHAGLRVAPATPDLAGANVELVNVEGRENKLSDILSEVKHAYDYIIIDCPPSLGILTLNGLVAADQILIPVQAEYYALEGLGQLLKTIDLVRDNIKPNLKVLGAVLTMFDSRNRLSEEVLHELYKYFPNNIFRSVIPRTVRLAEAPSFGKSIFHYEPHGKAARSYERLTREFLDRFENNN